MQHFTLIFMQNTGVPILVLWRLSCSRNLCSRFYYI